jgi:hypothetical protein
MCDAQSPARPRLPPPPAAQPPKCRASSAARGAPAPPGRAPARVSRASPLARGLGTPGRRPAVRPSRAAAACCRPPRKSPRAKPNTVADCGNARRRVRLQGLPRRRALPPGRVGVPQLHPHGLHLQRRRKVPLRPGLHVRDLRVLRQGVRDRRRPRLGRQRAPFWARCRHVQLPAAAAGVRFALEARPASRLPPAGLQAHCFAVSSEVPALSLPQSSTDPAVAGARRFLRRRCLRRHGASRE